MFRLFENRINPYPEAEPSLPPRRFLAFIWACTEGMHGGVAALAALAAGRAAYDAALFAMLGLVVDWLTQTGPDHF